MESAAAWQKFRPVGYQRRYAPSEAPTGDSPAEPTDAAANDGADVDGAEKKAAPLLLSGRAPITMRDPL